jgi:hypothetical protein
MACYQLGIILGETSLLFWGPTKQESMVRMLRTMIEGLLRKRMSTDMLPWLALVVYRFLSVNNPV